METARSFTHSIGKEQGGVEVTDVMTLRDYIAINAMQGLVASEPCNIDYTDYCDKMAKWSYAMSDAMLEARTK